MPGVDHQLLLAAALQCNKTENGGFNAVPAGGNQTVVLVNGRLDAPERVGDLVARLDLDRNLPRLVVDHQLVFKKHSGILSDRLQFFAQRRKRHAENCVRMAHRHDVGALLVHRRIEHEAGTVDLMQPSTTRPLRSARIRLDTFTCEKCTAIGLVQYRFGCSGSRTVGCPANP